MQASKKEAIAWMCVGAVPVPRMIRGAVQWAAVLSIYGTKRSFTTIQAKQHKGADIQLYFLLASFLHCLAKYDDRILHIMYDPCISSLRKAVFKSSSKSPDVFSESVFR